MLVVTSSAIFETLVMTWETLFLDSRVVSQTLKSRSGASRRDIPSITSRRADTSIFRCAFSLGTNMQKCPSRTEVDATLFSLLHIHSHTRWLRAVTTIQFIWILDSSKRSFRFPCLISVRETHVRRRSEFFDQPNIFFACLLLEKYILQKQTKIWQINKYDRKTKD